MNALKVIVFLIFIDSYMWANSLHVRLLEPFLGMTYREYGTTNIDEKYTTLINPKSIYRRGGLGDEGFVISAYKQLFGRNFRLNDILSPQTKERISQDDFALELALKLASNHKYKILSASSSFIFWSKKSFGILDIKSWKKIFEKLHVENVYLAIFSKKLKQKNIYFHLGIIIKDDNNNIWLYHGSKKSGVSRIWLDFDRKMSLFVREFGAIDGEMIILELETG